MPNLWRIENGRVHLGFSQHRHQSKAWRSTRRDVYIIAGTQGGKTSFGPWWLNREIYNEQWRQIVRPDKWEFEPGKEDYLAVTSSYDLFKLKMLPEMRTVFENLLGVGRYWAGERLIELKDPATGEFWAKHSNDTMWGRIILRSAHAGSGLESATAKAAWMDECGQDEFTLETREAIVRRLSLNEGRSLGTTTPYNLGWLKVNVYDAWADGDPDIDVITFSSMDNPAFPKREYERVKAKMQDWRFDMFYGGKFTKPAGLIYKDWNDNMLVDAFAIPDDWMRAVGVDFGGANTAMLWAAQNPDNEKWYAYDEWHGGGETSTEYRERLLSKMPDDADYNAWGGAPSETQARRDWGIVNAPPISAVEAGIDRATQLIKEDKWRVFRNLKGFRDEIGSYKRKLDSAQNPTDEIENKRTFHRMDAFRYMATGIIGMLGPWMTIS